jgi:hypothetical protein
MAMAAATNTVMDRGTAMHVRRRVAIEAVSAFQSPDTPAARVPHSFRQASARRCPLWVKTGLMRDHLVGTGEQRRRDIEPEGFTEPNQDRRIVSGVR